MPLYEYECHSCHQRLEKIQKFSDAPLTECPHCGGRLEKTISAPAVQFKGGGWYADLYSSSGAKKPGTTDSSAPGSSGDSSSSPAASDSKPAAASTPAKSS